MLLYIINLVEIVLVRMKLFVWYFPLRVLQKVMLYSQDCISNQKDESRMLCLMTPGLCKGILHHVIHVHCMAILSALFCLQIIILDINPQNGQSAWLWKMTTLMATYFGLNNIY